MVYNFRKAYMGKNNKIGRAIGGYASHLGMRAVRKGLSAYGLRRAANQGVVDFSGSGAYRRTSRKRLQGRQRRARQGNVGALRRQGNVWSMSHKEYISEIYSLAKSQTDAIGNTFGLSGAAGNSVGNILRTRCLDSNNKLSGAGAADDGEGLSVGLVVLVNPGNNQIFPWLSNIARNFQKFRFKKLIFHYKTITSESTANTSGLATSLGTMVMAANYDPIVSYEGSGGEAKYNPFTTMSEMLNSDGALQAKISKSMSFGIECSKASQAGKWYMTLPNGKKPVVGTDSRIWFQSMFQMAADNVPKASGSDPVDLGQLWVEYECEFMNPVLAEYTDHLANGALEDAVYVTFDAAATAASVDTFADPATVAAGDGIEFLYDSVNTISLKGLSPGIYNFEHEFSFASATAATTGAITYSGNFQDVSPLFGVDIQSAPKTYLMGPSSDQSEVHRICDCFEVVEGVADGVLGSEGTILFTYAKAINVQTGRLRIYRVANPGSYVDYN